jgi:CRP/FNR family cyclic AMP-dependent transcriptional regulator
MATRKRSTFSPKDFLASAGLDRKIVEIKAKQKVFAQGDPADSVYYIQKGRVKLSVISAAGKEAIFALLNPGEFLGEESIPGPDTLRMSTASALSPCTVLKISRKEMVRVIHEEHAFADLFVAFLLARTMRVQADLVDQLFNSSEKRLARILLLLARFGESGEPDTHIPKISQEALAEMIGTTRSRVSFFMNRFRKLGFIQYNGGIQVRPSLLNVILYD